MTKPRYDPDEDKSRHAAASAGDCEDMAQRNDWELVDVEETDHPILEVDCVFDGETEFPKPFNETKSDWEN